MDLLALADFSLVARHRGFGRAARATGRAKATLSRRVADLEAGMGVRLLERGTRDLKLTEEGQALFERASSLLADLEETAAAVASGGGRPRGRLKLSAPLLFSHVAMGPLAAGFVLKYPDVRLEVTTEDRRVDMIEEGFDLVIRVNPKPDESLIGHVFLRDRLAVVARPGFPRPTDGLPVPAVVQGTGNRSEWRTRTPTGQATITVEPVLGLSSMLMVRDAVKAGAGAGRLPVSLVSGDIADGTLVHWGDADEPDIALWTLYPTRRLLSARVSAFLDHLKQAFPEGTPDELAAFVAR